LRGAGIDAASAATARPERRQGDDAGRNPEMLHLPLHNPLSGFYSEKTNVDLSIANVLDVLYFVSGSSHLVFTVTTLVTLVFNKYISMITGRFTL
jgi:hypothetical protein